MTTHRPTASGDGKPDLGALGIDESALNQLAGQLFSAVPGAMSAPGPTLSVPAAGSVPANATTAPSLGGGPPGWRAGAAPAGVPGGTTPAIDVGEIDRQWEATDPGSIPRGAGAPFFPAIPDLEALISDAHFAEPVAQQRSPFYFVPDPGPAHYLTEAHPPFDVNAVRRDFPILGERVNGYPLVWFDNAATTQKPQQVIDRLGYFYAHENSNIHRAAHTLAARSTDAYEHARDTIASFIGAASAQEIIFVRGATEGMNLISNTWGRNNISEGDEIIISHLEHHANIVPWHLLAAETGAVLKVIPVDERGQLRLDEYTKLLSSRTKIVSIAHVSNALGTVTPVKQITEQAHRAGAVVIIDAAQSVPHTRINVQDIGADFLVFSGHKLYGPTGIGVVYGKSAVLQDTPPWQGGGNMISDVTLERSQFQPPPGRFEAGTGSIADAVGLGAAIDYLSRIGIENIARYEHYLLEYASGQLNTVPGLRLIGTAQEKASVASFVLDGYDPLEVGQALNEKGIAVRAGHHCAQPILRRYGLEATVRPSFAFYNTCAEIDSMIAVLRDLAGRAR